MLTEFSVAQVPLTNAKGAAVVTLQNATSSHNQKDLSADQAIDGKVDKKGWAISPKKGESVEAIFETKENFGTKGGTLLTFTLDHQFGDSHVIGKFRLAATTSARPVRRVTLPGNIANVILTPRDKRTPKQKAEIFGYFVSKHADVAAAIRLHAAQDIRVGARELAGVLVQSLRAS